MAQQARTFGMDSLFRIAGIYSPAGQNYRPVDADTLLPYREAVDGQILQEGICETGAIASFLAAGTAYAVHGVQMIPFYIFYSMFGFQRVGDMIWTCGDMLCRGFLLGGTAGRTTLNGEGLQHQDGHSQVVAETVPNLLSYDPAFAYELAVIIRDGIRRMYTEQEDVFYYLTLYNENIPMPPLPAEDPSEGILRGMYRLRAAAADGRPQANLLAAGPAVVQALAAADTLEALGVATTVWSVTSYNELYRDAQECARWNRLHPGEAARVSYIEAQLEASAGVYVSVSDYQKALGAKLAQWIPGPYAALGTDGYGLSESRAALRAHFEVDPSHMVLAALDLLVRAGAFAASRATEWMAAAGLEAPAV
jgi:pyruvate dehydrogenase E1 component